MNWETVRKWNGVSYLILRSFFGQYTIERVSCGYLLTYSRSTDERGNRVREFFEVYKSIGYAAIVAEKHSCQLTTDILAWDEVMSRRGRI